jgi:hypothetical protein
MNEELSKPVFKLLASAWEKVSLIFFIFSMALTILVIPTTT